MVTGKEAFMSDSYGSQYPFRFDENSYDLFEKVPDGGSQWLTAVVGLENANSKLQEIASRTANEVFVMDLHTSKVLARANVSKPRAASA
jgi:hypothetical protein